MYNKNNINKRLSLKKTILNLARMFLDKFLTAGLAYEHDTKRRDVDQEQLKMGINVEFEHTSSRKIAMRIALDHLTEIPDYYTRLKAMEEQAFKELNVDKENNRVFKCRNKNGV